jgi:hypothetical protein
MSEVAANPNFGSVFAAMSAELENDALACLAEIAQISNGDESFDQSLLPTPEDYAPQRRAN